MQPTAESQRIETLDVLRGFALLGILLLNIIGFGLHSAAYSNAGFDVSVGINANFITWASIEIMAEGAMRCLFSILFGAGVVLFLTTGRERGGSLHYRRTFWLMVFGLINAYILLWNGDILLTYALSGALLFLVRKWPARNLYLAAGILLLLISGFYSLMSVGLSMAKDAHEKVQQLEPGVALDSGVLEAARSWEDFARDFYPDPDAVVTEYRDRRESYVSAFKWNVKKMTGVLTFVMPMFLLWDALAMMLLGMALYKSRILQGEWPRQSYVWMSCAGFTVGLLFNGYEVGRAVINHMDIFSLFAQMQPTYHVGRLGMAMGYLGLLCLACQMNVFPKIRLWLAAVGRMALTNYLVQSLLCAILFTGLGFGLVGELARFELYPVVFGIWIVQLVYSTWWLERFRFGPVEWLWRALTYGELPTFRRSAGSGTVG